MLAAESFHVARTLRALELLAMSPRSAPELADALRAHVRTARRILKRLESEGYVKLQEGHRRRYRPTMRVVALAGQVIEQTELTQAAVPHVTRLRDELREACHLCVPSYLSALCLVHAPRGVDCDCRPHLRELVPCHSTAAGKALLAGREPWREAVLSQPLQRFTDRTLTGPHWLRRELERTAARGYAIEDREYQPHARGLAAPVIAHDGETVAALGVVAPVWRLPAERYGDLAQAVVRAVGALSSELALEPAEKPSARPRDRPKRQGGSP